VELPESFLQGVFNDFVDHETEAFVLFGSYSRGTAIAHSDVDLTRYVAVLPADKSKRFLLTYREGRLVAVLTTTFADAASQLKEPESAIWGVLALRTARILHDPEGKFGALQRDADAFRWAPMQAAADRYSSHRLMKFSEEAYKLAIALSTRNSARIMTETVWLVLGLPLVIATQKGIFLENETRAPGQVQHALGETSAWAQQYRRAAGIDETSGPHSVHVRGYATLQLYRESVRILAHVLLPPHRTVIHCVLAFIGEVETANFP